MAMFDAKSLKNISIERCANSFKRVFFEEVGSDKRLILKKEIALPPNLFENILCKNKEMANYIPPNYLKTCLSHRDSLCWRNIDLSCIGEGEELGRLGDEDLKNIANSMIPVSMLSFSTEEVTHTMMMYISTFASSLEYLHIGPERGLFEPPYKSLMRNEHIDDLKNLYKDKIKFPKLKYLSVNFFNMEPSIFDLIDLNSFSASIRYLELNNYDRIVNSALSFYELYPSYSCYSYSPLQIIHSIGNYKKLISLSLKNSNLHDHCSLMQSILTLQDLKTLDLTYFGSYMKGNFKFDLNDLISSLPKLSKLELNGCCVPWINVTNVESRRLKYIGIMNLTGINVTNLNAESIGSDSSLDGLLSTFVNINNDNIRDIILALSYKIDEISSENIDVTQWMRFEQGISRCICRYRYHGQILQAVMELIDRGDCINRWEKKILDLVANVRTNSTI